MATFIQAMILVDVAEMGDKTQLMTIALAADSTQPLFILAGTTAGMLIADAIGILGGAWLCKNVSEKYMKWIPGLIFLFFGTLTVYEAAPASWINLTSITIYMALLIGSVYLVGIKLQRKNPDVITTPEGFTFTACPYHHLLSDGNCPHLKLNSENQCIYNVTNAPEPCPISTELSF